MDYDSKGRPLTNEEGFGIHYWEGNTLDLVCATCAYTDEDIADMYRTMVDPTYSGKNNER